MFKSLQALRPTSHRSWPESYSSPHHEIEFGEIEFGLTHKANFLYTLSPKSEFLSIQLNPKLAKYQRISRLEFRETDFPRNALGKVLKRDLREPYWKNQ